MTKFVDANVFVYALLKPKRKLTEEERVRKERAEQIYKRIDKGEKVLSSVVHLSEVANILEDTMSLDYAAEWVEAVLRKPNIDIETVSRRDYLVAAVQARVSKVGVNDALAYVIMRKRGVKELYSFDRHLDNFDVRRIDE